MSEEPAKGLAAKPRWWRRKLVRIGGIVVLLLFLVAAMAPAILSTGFGRGWVLDEANASIPGRFSIQDWSLSWTGGQIVKALRLDDPAGEPVLRIANIETDFTLSQLVRGSYGRGTVKLDGLELDLVLDESGRLNFDRALGPDEEKESKPSRSLGETLRELDVRLPPSLDATLELTNARISVSTPDLAAPVTLSGVHGRVVMRAGEASELDLQGELGVGGSVHLQASITGTDEDGVFDIRKSRATLQFGMQLPQDPVARELADLIRRWLGDSLDLRVDVSMTEDGPVIQADVQSTRVQLKGSVRTWLLAEGCRDLALIERLDARIELTPAMAKDLAASGIEVDLEKNVPVSVSLRGILLPHDDPMSVPLEGEGVVELGDGSLSIEVDGKRERFSWQGWKATLAEREDSGGTRLTAAGRILQGDHAGEVSLDASLHPPESEGKILQAVRAEVKNFPLAPIDRLLQAFGDKEMLLVDALGETLDLSVEARPDGKGAASVTLKAKSERLSTETYLLVDWEKRRIRTRAQSDVSIRVSPSIARRFAPEAAPVPDEDVELKLRLESLTAPLDAFDPATTAVTAELSLSPLRFGATEVRDLSVRIESDKLTGAVNLGIDAHVGKGIFQLLGNLHSFWDENGVWQPQKAAGQLGVVVENLPLDEVDRILGAELSFADLLGKTLDASATLESDGKTASVTIRANSSQLDLKLPLALKNERLTLTEPASARYVLTPSAARTLLREGDWALAREQTVTLNLQSLSIPVRPGSQLAQLGITGTLHANGLQMLGPEPLETATFETLQVSVEGTSLAEGRIDVAGRAASTGLAGRALGGSLTFTLQCGLAEDDQRLALAAVYAKLESASLQLEAAAEKKANRFTLLQPATIRYVLEPAVLREVVGPDALLEKPVVWKVDVPALFVPADGSIWSTTGAVAVEAPLVSWKLGVEVTKLKDLEAALTLGTRLEATIHARIATSRREDAGVIDAAVIVKEWNSGGKFNRSAPVSAHADVKGVPVALLKALGRVGLDLPALIGPELNLDLNAELPRGFAAAEGGAGRLTVAVQSEHVDCEARLTAGKEIRLEKPATLRWTMTPSAWSSLVPGAELKPVKPVPMTFTIRELRVPLPDEGEELAGPTLRAEARVDPMELAGKAPGSTVTVQGLSLELEAPDLREALLVKLGGDLVGAEQRGSMSGTVRLKGLLDDQNRVVVKSLRDASVETDLQLKNMPVAALDRILKMNRYLVAVLGPRASMHLTTNLVRGTGPIDLELTSGNLKASLEARAKNQVFYLRRAAEAELNYSEELSDLVLPKLGPLFVGLESAERPMRLRVSPEGFRLPASLNIQEVVVPELSLDLGRVVLRNEDLFRALTALAGAGASKKSDAWFTPLVIEMRRGKVKYKKRLDMSLDDSFHLATWGEVDLVRNRTDIVLALMPKTLKNVLRLSAEPEETLQIPVRGPTDKPKFDVARAVKDLAAIRAKEDALQNVPEILRGITNRALRKLLKRTFKGPPPLPPSVDPLPWEAPKPDDR